jgi:hypothetical protein
MIAITALSTIREAGYRIPEKLPATSPEVEADAEPI